MVLRPVADRTSADHTSSAPRGSRGAQCQARRRRGGRVVMCALVLPLVGSLAPAAPASAANGGIYIGADGRRAQLEAQIGMRLASHAYGTLTGPVHDARLVNIQPKMLWRTVANAQPGSAVYADIVRWARGIKGNGHETLVSFQHEPETKGVMSRGDNSDFIAAYRRVVSVFRAEGATNVKWVWSMTAWSFHVPASDRRAAYRWYPGSSYVDYVGADPYNWHDCGPGHGGWVPLSNAVAPVVAFARAHGKQVVLPEFGTAIDLQQPGRKAAWIADAHRYLAANHADFAAIFYWNNDVNGRSVCQFLIKTRQEIDAFRAMAKDPLFRAP